MAFFLDTELAQLVEEEQKDTPSFTGRRPAGGGRPGKKRLTNQFVAPCLKCGKKVEKRQGILERVGPNWVTTHPECQ